MALFSKDAFPDHPIYMKQYHLPKVTFCPLTLFFIAFLNTEHIFAYLFLQPSPPYPLQAHQKSSTKAEILLVSY